MQIHIKSALKPQGFVSVGAIVDRVGTIRTGSVCISFSQSRLKHFEFGIVLRIQTGFSATMITEGKVFDERQFTHGAALITNYLYNLLQLVR